MGDALSIEYSFADLLGLERGRRSDVNDADVFRLGDHRALAKVLSQGTEKLEQRVKAIGLLNGVATSGGSSPRIVVAIDRLRAQATALSNSTSGPDGETYQWEIIGSLVGIVAAMLERMESK